LFADLIVQFSVLVLTEWNVMGIHWIR